MPATLMTQRFACTCTEVKDANGSLYGIRDDAIVEELDNETLLLQGISDKQ